MRWDEIIDPRLAYYRTGTLAGKKLKTGGVTPTPPGWREDWDEEFVAKRGDLRIEWSSEWSSEEFMRPLLGPAITLEAAYRALGLEPPE